MCDAIVALGNSTKDGSVLFGKNSDRHPNEPHIMVRVPRRQYPKNAQLRTTYITIPQVSETYQVLLLKPSWIWGCEMGGNEFGLNIGNEAVFTKEKFGPPGLIGMDMIRIALERCKTSEEAVDMIAELVTNYGQGGNCGFTGKVQYHNSFLIADRTSAWVLESAGHYWAAKKVENIYTISNGLSLENNFDRCHPELIQHAVKKRWCKGERDFSFKRCYSNNMMTGMVQAKRRSFSSYTRLLSEKGRITVDTLKKALRTHSSNKKKSPFSGGSATGVCMHSSFVKSHTTGSYIASIRDESCTFWVTGGSTPCISIFKPVWLLENTPLFTEQEHAAAVDYWRLREKLHRMVIAGMVDLDYFRSEQKDMEKSFSHIFNEINFQSVTKDKLAEIAAEAFATEAALINKTIKKAEQSGIKPKIKGSWLYKRHWKKLNRKLEIL